VVYAASAGYFLFFSLVSRFMYFNFLYEDQDLAIHSQILWGLVHGSSDSSILGTHFLANHQGFIFYLLKYFYLIFPSPLFLLTLQSFALASGGVLSYGLARKYLEPSWALLSAFLYLFYPGVGYSNLYEFHQMAIAVPFFFLTIFFYLENKFLPFLIFSIAAMSCQENIVLAIFMFGVMAFFHKRAVYWRVGPMFLSIAWFCAGVFLVRPKISNEIMNWLLIYGRLGHSLPEILSNLAVRPHIFLKILFSEETFRYVSGLLFPFLCLPLMGWRFLWVVMPFLAQHIFSVRNSERNMTFHYTLEMVPFFVIAAIEGLRFLLSFGKKRFFRRLLAAGLCLMMILFGVVSGPYIAAANILFMAPKNDRLVAFQHKLILQIPEKGPVVATMQFLAGLSQRQELYSFHHVYWGVYTMSTKKYALPTGARYALLDMDPNDSFTFNFKSQGNASNLDDFFHKLPWHVIDFGQDTLLLEKGKTDFSALYEVNPKGMPPPELFLKTAANQEIYLEGVTFQKGNGIHKGQLGIRFYWKCLKKTSQDYGLVFRFTGRQGSELYRYERSIGYRIFPTSRWNVGESIAENYWLILPNRVLKEHPVMSFGIKNTETGKTEAAAGPIDSFL